MFKVFKRLFDVISAMLALLVLSPVLLVLTILVRVNLGAPILFRQKRTGKNMKPFYINKFRTMTNEKDADGNLLPDDQRQTKFGCFLRSTSLDELPELLNIIVGDMSVIGPRSLPPVYDDYYTEYEKKRFSVRGGLIPPDSVEESAIISWDKQLECEARYAQTLSLKNDIKILISVFRILFTRKQSDYGTYVRRPLNEEREKAADGVYQTTH